MIWSKENGYQFDNCFMKLLNDPHTREACMIYNRPSMQEEYCKNGMHDFCCTYAVQCFLNEDKDNRTHLKYIVYMRSNDAVFGFDNDALWHQNVQNMLADKLSEKTALNKQIICDNIIWNAGSLHIYERHFKYLK
jgi:thymidylate synthase